MKPALVLSGGGARGAYQVGVLKAIGDLHAKHARNPFSIISGTSAGAVNAVALAASANNFRLAVKKVEKIWGSLHVDKVYRAGGWDMIKSQARLVGSLFNQGIGRSRPLSVLNNDPLRDLLLHTIQFKNIQKRIDEGFLDAVCVTATGYTSGENVTFFQAREGVGKWRQGRRVGVPTKLNVSHIMGSSAIPIVLPAEKISREYFGDGALRQLAPISPVIRMGADRVLVIGVSGNPTHVPHHEQETHSPSLAQMAGHVFNSAFIDSLEHDIDTLARINDLVAYVENENPHAAPEDLRKIDLLVIYPSVEFDEIAARHVQDLPRAMRVGMRVIGATKGGGGTSLASYLLFEKEFCKELIDYGYRDAMAQKDSIMEFFNPELLAPLGYGSV
ncbi:MAG: patatin-like phospholipase family protein [Halioglobus sp.]|nr:patatin-like phospholipase family protein [Halioglobus sp.]